MIKDNLLLFFLAAGVLGIIATVKSFAPEITKEPRVITEQKLDAGFSRYVKSQEEALEASVRVEYGRVTGSGFVIRTYLDETKTVRAYEIVTAAHILDKKHYDPSFPLLVRFTKHGMRMSYQAEILWVDDETDVAVLIAWGMSPFQLCLPFEIVDNDDYLQYAKDVYMISYPQGYGPMLTEGIISGISILDWDTEAYTTTAQSAPGSSGGAIVDANTGQVLGLLKAVVTKPGSPHMFGGQSIVAPADQIRRIVALSDGDDIIPAGPRGAETIVLFTSTQEPTEPRAKK